MRKIPILVWFLVPTLIIIGAGIWFFTKSAPMDAKDDVLGEVAPVSQPVSGTVDYQAIGRNHINAGTEGSGYNSNPPSSGPHWPGPAKNGVYGDPLADEQALHSMEHGYVWVTYKKEVGDEVRNKLEEIVKNDDWKVIISLREANDAKIALVAWGRVLKMDEPDYDKIKNFIKTYRNRGPEKTPN